MGQDSSFLYEEAFRLLRRSKNLLISGPPGTGKTKLMSELARRFMGNENASGEESGDPRHDPSGTVPIPAGSSSESSSQNLPLSENKNERQVFRTVFHQNSKYRDFITGMVPDVKAREGGPAFKVMTGTLYRAAEHAKSGASLLIIDEINRGPAVQVFGGAIVSIEGNKRLLPEGRSHSETQYFEILCPETGEIIEYALPNDLYIVAAMNQADTSVEPLDVAFIRRWEPLKLEPSIDVLRDYYGIERMGDDLPDSEPNLHNLMAASVAAFKKINERICIGRGKDYQVGHGILMSGGELDMDDVKKVKRDLSSNWNKVLSHLEEIFFGDVRGMGAVLNAIDGPAFNPFRLEEATFADNLRFILDGPSSLTEKDIYEFLRAVAHD